MKNNLFAAILFAFVLLFYLSGCSMLAGISNTNTGQAPPSLGGNSGGNAPTYDLSDSDTDTSWSEIDPKISLNGSVASVSGSGATADGSVVTITEEGTYVVSGALDDGQIVVAATNAEKVHLVLNGVSVTNRTGAAIYAVQCDKLIVTLAENTQNELTDGGSGYVFSDTVNEEPNAALFSKDDLTINGTGSLTVNAGFNNGIGTKDDLLIVNGNITVTAANHGLRGNDSVTILNGNIAIVSGGDGIRTNNSDDPASAYILIEGGDFAITAGGGYPGMSIKINKKLMGGRFGGVDSTAENTSDAGGGKSINASGSIEINGGTFDLSAYDDAIHSDVDITVSDGTFTAETGATGLQAPDVTIHGGNITVLNSYEGIEGENTVTINDGTLTLTASDDGINVSSATGAFYLNGGEIVITAGADGIDINGNIVQSGGRAVITAANNGIGGDGPIDYDGTFTRTGGTMVDADGNELSTEKLQMGGQGGGMFPGGQGGPNGGFPGLPGGSRGGN